IGAGMLVNGTVGNTAAVNCTVKTGAGGELANVGIGAGMLAEGGKVGSTTAVNSRVETRNPWTDAGIGGGWVSGTVGNTTAVNCNVSSAGSGAIGGGGVLTDGIVGNTAAVKCEVKVQGNDADGIGAGKLWGKIVGDSKAVNTSVNGKPKGSGSLSDYPDLCQRADPRLLAPDCTVKREYMDSFSRSLDNDCPVEIPVLFLSVAGGGLVAGGYIAYHLITGYRQGLRGAQLR
uniref:hypothetical protein n=1 Tax=Endozoicomonas acroporae TaxID=1701104 RepID=UPI0019D5BDBD